MRYWLAKQGVLAVASMSILNGYCGFSRGFKMAKLTLTDIIILH